MVKAGLPLDKARASQGRRLLNINQVAGKTQKQLYDALQGSNSFCGVLEMGSSGDEVQHKEKSSLKRRPFRSNQVTHWTKICFRRGRARPGDLRDIISCCMQSRWPKATEQAKYYQCKCTLSD